MQNKHQSFFFSFRKIQVFPVKMLFQICFSHPMVSSWHSHCFRIKEADGHFAHLTGLPPQTYHWRGDFSTFSPEKEEQLEVVSPSYLIFVIFFTLTHFCPENFACKSAWIYDKKGLATKQRKSIFCVKLHTVCLKLSTVCKTTHSMSIQRKQCV